MTKNVALLISVGILLLASGCSKPQQGSGENAPAAETASIAPASPALPAVNGHWTITFKRLRMKKDGSFMPGTGKDIGVLNVDLMDGVNVIEGNHAICTQHGNIYGPNGFPNLNFDMPRNDRGKFEEGCFTSIGNFDGSSGQLSHTVAVLGTADYEMQHTAPSLGTGEAEKVLASTMARYGRLAIKFDGFSMVPFDANTVVSGNMMYGEWHDAQNYQYGGTLLGKRD